jgi:hypothetical protein
MVIKIHIFSNSESFLYYDKLYWSKTPNLMIRLLFTAFFILSSLCSITDTRFDLAGFQEQGVEGFVYRISGNQMPSPGTKPSMPKGIPTTIYVFELTNIKQVSRLGQTAFYKSIKTKFVRKLESAADGHFSVQLPVGSYSFFTMKNDLFYANWFDTNYNIAPVSVMSGKMTAIKIRIDYEANY